MHNAYLQSCYDAQCWLHELLPILIRKSTNDPTTSIDNICIGLFLGYLLVSLIDLSILLPIPHCLHHCNFIYNVLKSGSINFVLLALCFVLLSFAFSLKLQNQFVNSHKIICWDSDWKCAKPIDQCGKHWHLENT